MRAGKGEVMSVCECQTSGEANPGWSNVSLPWECRNFARLNRGRSRRRCGGNVQNEVCLAHAKSAGESRAWNEPIDLSHSVGATGARCQEWQVSLGDLSLRCQDVQNLDLLGAHPSLGQTARHVASALAPANRFAWLSCFLHHPGRGRYKQRFLSKLSILCINTTLFVHNINLMTFAVVEASTVAGGGGGTGTTPVPAPGTVEGLGL